MFIASYEQGTLLGVFDGHGGAEVSEFVSEELPAIFADLLLTTKTPRQTLKKAIERVAIETENYRSGSTLSLVFIPFKGRFVYCAVIGDSPIIIKDSKGNINIGPDHNVRTNEEEAAAAVERGGMIRDGYLLAGFYGPGLQMARALGDAQLSRVLSRKPDIYSVRVNKDSFVIVASDGAFDPGHYEFEKAAEDVVKLVELGSEAQAVVTRAVEARTEDNVTALVARFEETK